MHNRTNNFIMARKTSPFTELASLLMYSSISRNAFNSLFLKGAELQPWRWKSCILILKQMQLSPKFPYPTVQKTPRGKRDSCCISYCYFFVHLLRFPSLGSLCQSGIKLKGHLKAFMILGWGVKIKTEHHKPNGRLKVHKSLQMQIWTHYEKDLKLLILSIFYQWNSLLIGFNKTIESKKLCPRS